MSKVIKLTEADLRRIISEKLEGDLDEQGIIKGLMNRAAKALSGTKPGPKSFMKDVPATKGAFNRVVSTMRTEVAQLLAKTPEIKITPKTVKVLEEPRYNARVAYDLVNELGTEGVSVGSIRGEYSGIESSLRKVQGELKKPAGQQLNIKEMMENLYYAKDELAQDIIKRPKVAKDVPKIQATLKRLEATINHIENLFKTPDKPTTYLVKEEPKL